MFKYLKRDRWSPYIAGLMIAILSMSSFFLLNKMIGTSTTIVRLAAALWYIFDPNHVLNNDYYMKYLNNSTWINWQFMLLIGIFFGSLVAGRLHEKSPVVHVPSIWKERFGSSRIKRYLGAFIGGVIIIFGARLADGCTSGHGISGGMQQAVTSWVFMLGLFAFGIPSAFLIYRTKKGDR